MPNMHLENIQNAIVSSSILTEGGDVLANGQKITNIYHSAQYQELEKAYKEIKEQLTRAKEKIAKYPDDQDFRVDLLRISERLAAKQKQIDDLKGEVIQLAGTFTKISINT